MPTYEDLVRDYHSLAFRVARSVVRDDASAEDAVQDVYLRFLRDPASLERVENLKAFVARAAVNAALDQKRSAGRREKHERAAIREGAVMNPVEAASRAELRSKVAELPDEQRIAVEMHYFHGLTKEETAAALQVPAGTVSSRLNTALGRLRTALSAAAFAGLLAMLESELGKCAAGETVPEGLRDRLMRLGTQSPAPSPSRATNRAGTVAAIAGAILLAVLLGLVARHEMQEREANEFHGAADGVVADASSPAAPSPKSTPAADPASTGHAPAVAPVSEETVLEGFLFSRNGGVFVRDVTAWDHGPKQTIWNPRAEQLKAWRESLTIEGGVKGLEAPAAASFGPFLMSGAPAEAAPRARVKLRVRGPAAPGPEAADDDMRMEAPKFAAQPVELVEVIEAEVLGTAWLHAWRDMQHAATAVHEAWQLAPGPEKRSRLLEAATRLGTAWELARAARRGDATVEWRVQCESDAVSGVNGNLASVALDGLLPAWPTRDDLHGVLMDAASPADLRDSAIRRWGAESLGLDAWCYRSRGPGAWSWSSMKLSDAAAMNDAEFQKLKEELESIAENRPKTPDGPAMQERRRQERARVAAFGLEVEPLSPLDRERHLVECGALVRSVAPASAADRLGLVAGDILWKTVAEFEGKGRRFTSDVPVWGESGLATILGESGDFGGHVLALKVLRGGETVEIRIRD